MEQENISLFEVDEDTGELVYVPAEDETGTDIAGDSSGDVAGESEVTEDAGDAAAPSDEVGDMVLDTEDVTETPVETEEDTAGVALLDAGDSGVPVVLSEDVTAAILAASPAGGALGSSTLDYFDRIVSGLPADYKYIAYRTNSDNSYDGVLYYGDDFEVGDNMITFGDDATQIYVERVSSSYSSETNYVCSDVSDVSVDFSQSGTVLYYTNAVAGYPLLGGYEMKKGMSFYIVPALIGVLARSVMLKLSRR